MDLPNPSIGCSLDLCIQVSNSLSISESLFYRPFHSLSNKDLDFEDANVENSLNLSYQANDNVSITYENTYTWDIRKKRIEQQPSSQMRHSFNVSYTTTF